MTQYSYYYYLNGTAVCFIKDADIAVKLHWLQNYKVLKNTTFTRQDTIPKQCPKMTTYSSVICRLHFVMDDRDIEEAIFHVSLSQRLCASSFALPRKPLLSNVSRRPIMTSHIGWTFNIWGNLCNGTFESPNLFNAQNVCVLSAQLVSIKCSNCCQAHPRSAYVCTNRLDRVVSTKAVPLKPFYLTTLLKCWSAEAL